MICIPNPPLCVAAGIVGTVYWLSPNNERDKIKAMVFTAGAIGAAAAFPYLFWNRLFLDFGAPFDPNMPRAIVPLAGYIGKTMFQFTAEGMKVGGLLSAMSLTVDCAAKHFHNFWTQLPKLNL